MNYYHLWLVKLNAFSLKNRFVSSIFCFKFTWSSWALGSTYVAHAWQPASRDCKDWTLTASHFWATTLPISGWDMLLSTNTCQANEYASFTNRLKCNTEIQEPWSSWALRPTSLLTSHNQTACTFRLNQETNCLRRTRVAVRQRKRTDLMWRRCAWNEPLHQSPILDTICTEKNYIAATVAHVVCYKPSKMALITTKYVPISRIFYEEWKLLRFRIDRTEFLVMGRWYEIRHMKNLLFLQTFTGQWTFRSGQVFERFKQLKGWNKVILA